MQKKREIQKFTFSIVFTNGKREDRIGPPPSFIRVKRHPIKSKVKGGPDIRLAGYPASMIVPDKIGRYARYPFRYLTFFSHLSILKEQKLLQFLSCFL